MFAVIVMRGKAMERFFQRVLIWVIMIALGESIVIIRASLTRSVP